MEEESAAPVSPVQVFYARVKTPAAARLVATFASRLLI